MYKNILHKMTHHNRGCFTKVMDDKNKWYFDNCKLIKVFGKNKRIAFQRKGHHVRGVTITEDSFRNLEDVSIIPSFRKEIEKDTCIYNIGSRIQIVKYCMSKDECRCEGGFFNFTPKEWYYFWNTMRPKIMNYL